MMISYAIETVIVAIFCLNYLYSLQ